MTHRILVIDDVQDTAEAVAILLTTLGHEAKPVSDPRQAVDVAREFRPAMVLLDIGMPGMNGYQLAEALRALPGYESTPLIAVTGFTMYEDRERARAAGFDGFLTKPINPSDLIDAVKRLCG
jgi:CheY-like chemotaxis protein